MTRHQLIVKGMHCKSCETLVKEALEDAGATSVRVLLNASTQTGIVSCEFGGSKQALIDTIAKEGYTAQ